MGNYFDRLDEPKTQQGAAPNPFDQFDEPAPAIQFNLHANRDINTPTVFDQENAGYRQLAQYTVFPPDALQRKRNL